MTDKEVAELRRRFRPEHHNISQLYGCYIDSNGQILSQFSHSLTLLPGEEQEKYLDLLRKALSGHLGRSLREISFSTAQVQSSDEHRLLSGLRSSGLEDETLRQKLFETVAGSLRLEDPYLILLACDRYDVPASRRDGELDRENGDTVFTGVLCSICPVKETKSVLRYDAAAGDFKNRGADLAVSAPEVGFLFPAFDDRSTNLYGALYYTRSKDTAYEPLVTALFNTQPPMPVTTQKETFRDVLTEALEEECTPQVVERVRSGLRELVQLHKETRDPATLEVSPQEMGTVLEDCGVSERRRAAFRVGCDAAFGPDAVLPPQNLLNPGTLEYRTPDVVIKVNPDRQDLISTRTLGGVNYVLVNGDEGIEINGVPVRFPETE